MNYAEMSQQEFLDRVQEKYAQYADVQYQDVKDWLSRNINGPSGYAILYSELRESYSSKYRKPPLEDDLAKIWRKIKVQDPVNSTPVYKSALDRGMEMFPRDIAAECYRIQKKSIDSIAEGLKPTNAEVDFVALWGALEYYWGAIVTDKDNAEQKVQGNRVCTEVKKLIARGEKVPITDAQSIKNPEAYFAAATGVQNKTYNAIDRNMKREERENRKAGAADYYATVAGEI